MYRLSPIFTLLLLCFKSLSQEYQVDNDFLKSIDGKYFAFSNYDNDKEQPYGLLFQFKHVPQKTSIEVRNIIALSKWDKGTSYRGSKLELKEIDTTQFVFAGTLKAKYSDGDSAEVECELKIKLYNTEKFETWLYLPADRTVWGYCKTGTFAFAKGLYDKNVAGNTAVAKSTANRRQLSPVAFTDDLSVITYLNGKTFKAATGTEVQIGYSSEFNSYGMMINGRTQAFNLTYTPLTSYKAVVEGDMLSGGRIKVYVNSALHTLQNGTTIYTLK